MAMAALTALAPLLSGGGAAGAGAAGAGAGAAGAGAAGAGATTGAGAAGLTQAMPQISSVLSKPATQKGLSAISGALSSRADDQQAISQAPTIQQISYADPSQQAATRRRYQQLTGRKFV